MLAINTVNIIKDTNSSNKTARFCVIFTDLSQIHQIKAAPKH